MEVEKLVCIQCGKEFNYQPFFLFDLKCPRPKMCSDCYRVYLEQKNKEESKEFLDLQIKAQKEEQYKKCRIPKEFWGKDFNNFIPKTESQKEALFAAKEIVSGDLEKLIMLGQNGVGKSHLANSILDAIGGVRYSAYEFFAKYRECYSPLAKMTETEYLNSFKKEKCVVIDELGRTKGSEAEINFLSWFIDEMHTNGIKLVFTSNKIRKKDCYGYIQNPENCTNCTKNLCIERFLGNDSISRLSSKSKIITVIGEDYRRVH